MKELRMEKRKYGVRQNEIQRTEQPVTQNNRQGKKTVVEWSV